MEYSVSNYLWEPGVKQKDGEMLNRGAPLKFVILKLKDINKVHSTFKCLRIKNKMQQNDYIKKSVVLCLFYSKKKVKGI